MDSHSSGPSITVLMPVYNAARFLKEAIESILNQTWGNFEFLIVDDGSSDDSVSIIRSYSDPRIRLVLNDTNLGLSPTLNKGLGLAQGAFIARMDADDVSAPIRLERQRHAFLKDPELVGVSTAVTILNVHGEPLSMLPVLVGDEQIRRALSVTNPLAHASMMFRRDAVLALGGYNPDTNPVEDFDLWTRLSALGRLANLDDSLLSYRLNPEGMSIVLQKQMKEQSDRIMERVWSSFGEDGPAPLRDWNQIWPEPRTVALAYLHRLFAEGYRKRGRWGLALRHFFASFGWSASNRGSVFAALMFLMPYRSYSRLEERKTVFLKNARAGVPLFKP